VADLPLANLGRSGAKVTRICLGTMGFGAKSWRPWVVERSEALPILRRALDLGDHVDLYQIHRFDEEAPVDETLSTLSGFVDEGKARYLGASTMWAWQLGLLLGRQREKGWHPFVTMQNHWNLVYREEEREMVPLCRHEGVGLIPWSPLARGFLAGQESRERGPRLATDHGRAFYGDPQSREIAQRVDELAKRKSATPSQVALAWLLHQPGVVAPIVGVTKMRHLEEAVEAVHLRLAPDELRWLEEPYRPQPIAGWLRTGGVPREHLHPDEP
jgi:aryl-alcohol dehydrogenase-like predicted oxidoreductase